jgi:hypothetical protein
MLGLSNPNGQTDLHDIYTQTEKDSDGNSWFYFGWSRDSNSGSGFISFEAHQQPNDCVSYSDADLQNCNPWSPRTTGDFVIFWDQSGNSTNVYLRVWNGTSFQPAQPGLLLNTLKDPDGNPVVFAKYSADLFRGEMALNLTGAGLVGANECKAFTNVIPGTITGNSQGDQADFKDVVLAPISINTCGGITVTKVTLGPDGKAKADTTNSFSYTLTGPSTNTTKTIKGCTASDPNACNGPVDTYSDLVSGSYTLKENNASTLPGGYGLVSIACGASTTATDTLTFTLPESGSRACPITNQLPKGTPQRSTTPTVKTLLYDSLTDTLENALPANTSISGVTFELFKDSANCSSGQVSGQRTASITFTNGTTGTVNTDDGTTTVPPAFLITAAGTYYWKVVYPGDSLNNGFTICGEPVTVQ